MDSTIWMTFFLSCLLLALSPGAGAINSMSITIKHGLQKSLIANLGLQIGNIINITLVGAGIGTLLAQSDILFSILKCIGAIYLVYLGIKKLQESPLKNPKQEKRRNIGSKKLIIQSIIVNVTNPKSIVFLVALLPQFISADRPYLEQIFILAGTLVLVDSIVMMGYSFLADKILSKLEDDRYIRLLNRLFGGMFISAGAVIAAGSQS
jgi:homoserine/homoserine lactone efflux protein